MTTYLECGIAHEDGEILDAAAEILRKRSKPKNWAERFVRDVFTKVLERTADHIRRESRKSE